MAESFLIAAGITGSMSEVSVSALNPLPVTLASSTPNAPTPVVGAATAVATGGTAVTVFPFVTTEGNITNPGTATESLFVDIVNTAQTSAPGTAGTNLELLAGQTYAVPPTAHAVSVNAITSGHTFTAFRW